jgi:8-oxo-dGTP pyrophosphatase MutT (NUDIX family)
MNINTADYPHLFCEVFWAWGPIHATFELLDAAPTNVSNVNVVPFVGDRCVIVQHTNGLWEIVGGTLEPDEPYLQALTREAREEAGARLLNFTPFGAWKCHSDAPKPYRPHMPHPDFYRLVGYGEVELDGVPLNPADAEQVAKVEVVTVEEAVSRYRSVGRDDFADLYLLAAKIRSAYNAGNK